MCEDEDLYEYGDQYMTRAQLCWAMATCSGTWTAKKVGKFTRFSEAEMVDSSEFKNCFKIRIDNDE